MVLVRNMIALRRSIPAWVCLALGPVVAVLSSRPAFAQQDPAVLRGVEYLKANHIRAAGESAMIALGLMKAEVPSSNAAVQACLTKVRGRFSSSDYDPEYRDGHGNYEAAAAIMALSTEDVEGNRGLIAMVATYLIGHQNPNGSWDYVVRTQGDTSISQYAVLGLWEAENAGVDVPPSIWDRAASWFMSVQSGAGSWNYHRDDPSRPETCAMTAAGVGSLLICQRQLERYRQTKRGASTLLKSLVTEGTQADYRPSNSNAQLDQAIKRGLSWLSANFALSSVVVAGQTPYYMLYGLERIGALADRQTIGKVDWYARGREFILSTQRADGSWHSTFGAEMNTVWAILFMTKSTAKTMQRIQVKRLGAGTLLGGRELPKDLSSMTVAGGRVVSRPMNGAIEGMLAVLEDPRVEQADTAAAGVVERYYTEGTAALRPFKARFKRMLSDRDPGVRRVGVWALAHTDELAVAPLLIDALATPNQDEEVVTAARLGLQLLSRKIDGLGPPSPSTPEQRLAAAQDWRQWYEAIRPLDIEDQEEQTTAPAGPGPPAPPPAPAAAPSGSAQR
jgi:hypothetical protein